jgi:hypothetical protein
MGGLLTNKLGCPSLSAWRSLLSMAGVALGLLSPGCVPPPSPLIAVPSPPETVQPVSPQFLPRPPSAVQMVRLPSPPPPQADQSLSPPTSPIPHALQGLSPPPPPRTDESLLQQTAVISPALQGPSPPSPSQTGQSPSPLAAATKEEKDAAELALVSCLFDAVRYDDRKSDLIGVAVGLQIKCHGQFVRYIATYTRGMDLETRRTTEDKVAREELSLATSAVVHNRVVPPPPHTSAGDGEDHQGNQPRSKFALDR